MAYTPQYPESVLCDLACMILSNLTAYTTPCLELLKLEVEVIPIDNEGRYYPPQSRSVTAPTPTPYPSAPSKTVPALPLLVDAFAAAAAAAADSSKRKGHLHFLGSVFANLSTVSSSIERPLPLLKRTNTDSGRTEVLPFPSPPVFYQFFRLGKV